MIFKINEACLDVCFDLFFNKQYNVTDDKHKKGGHFQESLQIKLKKKRREDTLFEDGANLVPLPVNNLPGKLLIIIFFTFYLQLEQSCLCINLSVCMHAFSI